MKKVLFIATVDSHILHFHIPYLKLFKEQGYEVHVVTNGRESIPYCDKKHTISLERSPFKINNIKAIFQLNKILKKEHYDIVHCHTPMGGVVTRLASIKERKAGTKIIYTAHGFHFFKGAPLLNWFLFYPIEKYLAKYTDHLITINEEDFNLAKNKFKKRCKNIHYIPGVGIDEEKFKIIKDEKIQTNLKKEIGINEEDFVILCVGELNNNKNQIIQIEMMKEIVEDNKNIKLLLAGQGVNYEFYKSKIKDYNLENNVKLLGYRRDIANLLSISQILISTSKREGLPVSVMEALGCEIPVIALGCRGMSDLIINEKNGFIVDLNSTNVKQQLKEKIFYLKNNSSKYNKMKKECRNSIKKFTIKKVMEEMQKIYFK